MSHIDNLWFSDGNITVLVGDNTYHLYSGMLYGECESIKQHTHPEAGIGGYNAITFRDTIDDVEAENIRVLLLHVFSPAQAHRRLTARNILAILNLSVKYGAKNVKEQLEKIVSSMYPTDYDAFLASQLPARVSAAPFDYTTLESNVDFANAAREHNMLAYLPVALYRLCKLDQQAVFDSGLSPSNVRAVVVGRPRLSIAAKRDAFALIVGQCHENIINCQVARMWLSDSLAGADGWVDPFQTYSLQGICISCVATGNISNGILSSVWRNLPTFFGVQVPRWH